MDYFLCKNQYIPGKRQPIYCKLTEKVCAHQYYCAGVGKWRPHKDAEQCPAKDKEVLNEK